MRNGGDKRGNSRDRASRKRYLLSTFGDGSVCNCVHCDAPLTYETVESDRVIPGSTYRRTNIQPSCRGCNARRSNNALWLSPLALQAGGLR